MGHPRNETGATSLSSGAVCHLTERAASQLMLRGRAYSPLGLLWQAESSQ